MAAELPKPNRSGPRVRLSVLRMGIYALIVSLAVAAVFGIYSAFFRGEPLRRPGPQIALRDPRVDYVGPFLNVNPTVRYVPDEQCADCHADKARSFAEHPMGRSLLVVGQDDLPPLGAGENNPFEALGSRFVVDRDRDTLWHRRIRLGPDGRPAVQMDWNVRFVIGSGTRGFSYLATRDGYLFETPISWYSQKKIWALSPGFDVNVLGGRAIIPDCLYCHANRSLPIEGTSNRYKEPIFDGHAIGCQRCHGPGQLHVTQKGPRAPAAPNPDWSIVNPRDLQPPLRPAICEQCHLQGKARLPMRGRGIDDFRPGLALESFWSVFMRAGDGEKAVGQVEQMYQSRCYQAGNGPDRLSCVSCHDPHVRVTPAERVSHYRASCLGCHEQHGCKLPAPERLRKSAADSCIDCHMPRYGSADIPHTASTDHRIPRSGKSLLEHRPSPGGDSLPLVSFYRGRPGLNETDDERGRAIACLSLARAGDPAGIRALGRVLSMLDAALERDPSDLSAREARAFALGLMNRPTESLAAFEELLANAPEREVSLTGAAVTAEWVDQGERAVDYWHRALALNPWAPDYRQRFVLLLIKNKSWDEAEPACRDWLRVDPFSTEARAARVTCLLALGNKAEARAEFSRIEALAPADLGELRIRFERKLKESR